MNYYIADTHFGHENIIKHDFRNGGRVFKSIDEHDNLIIENINKIVTLQDNLYFLGDVSLYKSDKTAELIEKINCKNLYLLRGNHDRWIKDGKCKKLFQGIYDVKQIEDNNRLVFLCHYPIMMYPGQHRGMIHLYAHVHNTIEEKDYQEFIMIFNDRLKERDGERFNPLQAYNVGCMLWNYKPVTLDEILNNKIK